MQQPGEGLPVCAEWGEEAVSDQSFVPKDTTKPYEIVLVVFRHDFSNHGDARISLAQTSLWFKNTKEVLDWSDNSGVDFS